MPNELNLFVIKILLKIGRGKKTDAKRNKIKISFVDT